MKKSGFGLMRLLQTDAQDYSSVDIEKVKKLAESRKVFRLYQKW